MPLVVKNMVLGAGAPKTIVSLMGDQLDVLVAQARRAVAAGVDCLEWRADTFGRFDDSRAIVATARALGTVAGKVPLLFTLRTRGQGGEADLDVPACHTLTSAVLKARVADLVDLEYPWGDDVVRDLADYAHRQQTPVIASLHHFDGTPAPRDMCDELEQMVATGADVPKLAVMAHSRDDAWMLMRAVRKVAREHEEHPFIGIAMGEEGCASRIMGEVFGSAATFCALEQASAPGQVPIAQAQAAIEAIHQVLAGGAPDA